MEGGVSVGLTWQGAEEGAGDPKGGWHSHCKGASSFQVSRRDDTHLGESWGFLGVFSPEDGPMCLLHVLLLNLGILGDPPLTPGPVSGVGVRTGVH